MGMKWPDMLNELEIRALGTLPRAVVEEGDRVFLKLFDPEKGVDCIWCVLSPLQAHLLGIDLIKAALRGQK